MSLRLAPLACALILAACGGSQPDPGSSGAGGAEAKVLNVYNWSDYVADDTIANFEEATGIRVNYDVYAENETLETKLTAGGSGYDVVFPSARPFAQRQIRAGLLAELDRSKLPNLQNLDPSIMEGLTDIDPDNAHVVPYMWGTTGLGVNVEKVTAALGPDAPLDSWALLFDPANAEKLASCGIHVLDDDQEAFGAALIWLGRDPNAGSADEIDAVRQVYAAIRPHIRTFNNAEYKDALANGDACLVMGYSGDIGQARDVATEAAEATGAGLVRRIQPAGAMFAFGKRLPSSRTIASASSSRKIAQMPRSVAATRIRPSELSPVALRPMIVTTTAMTSSRSVWKTVKRTCNPAVTKKIGASRPTDTVLSILCTSRLRRIPMALSERNRPATNAPRMAWSPASSAAHPNKTPVTTTVRNADPRSSRPRKEASLGTSHSPMRAAARPKPAQQPGWLRQLAWNCWAAPPGRQCTPWH